MLSAWDKGRGEGLTPAGYFENKLPLLSQYLCCGADEWIWRTYGVSAQGGEYDRAEESAEKVAEAAELRSLYLPSTRIQLVGPNGDTHDLTEPLSWLMG